MKRFAPWLALAASASALAVDPIKIVERTLPISVALGGEADLALLESGSFAAYLNDATDSRVYFVSRTGTVQGLRYIPGVRILAMTVIGNDVVVTGVTGSAAARNSYVARLSATSTVWQTVLDASTISVADTPYAVVIGSDQNVYVSGGVQSTGLPYGFCLSFNPNSGALRFKTARATAYPGFHMVATNNGRIHMGNSLTYWRLSQSGVTELITNQPADIGIIKMVTKGTDLYLTGYKTIGDRITPYIQKRSNLGALIWERLDSLADGPSTPDHWNEYNTAVLDGAGYLVVGGGVSRNETQHSPVLRWSPAGVLDGAYFTDSSTIHYEGGPVTVDPYNQIYTAQRVTTESSTAASSLLVYKYTNTMGTRLWTAPLRDVSGLDAGKVLALALHGPSGDLITLHRTEATPSQTVWQVWRQQALPVAEAYNVATFSAFNSPYSVLANDRFREGAVLELVSTTTKGTLNLNPTTGNFTYTRGPSTSGSDKFIYRLRKNGLVGAATTVTLNLL